MTGKIFLGGVYSVEKDAPELGDTTRRVFPALFWECAIGNRFQTCYVSMRSLDVFVAPRSDV